MRCEICGKETNDITLKYGPIAICRQCGGRKMWVRFRRVKAAILEATRAEKALKSEVQNLAIAIQCKKESFRASDGKYVPCTSKQDYTCFIDGGLAQ